jgi:hypothetical protein
MAGNAKRQSGFFLFNFSQFWNKPHYAPLILLEKRFGTLNREFYLPAHQC